MEVSYDEVGVLKVNVGGHVGQEYPGDPSDEEIEHHTQNKQHRGLQPQSPHPHGAQRRQEHDPGRYGNQFRHDHERDVQEVFHPAGEQMMGPNEIAQHDDGHETCDHQLVRKHRLT